MEHQIDKLFRRQHRAKLAIFAVIGLLVVLTLAVVVMTRNTDQALTFFSSAAEPGACRVSMSGVNSCHFGEGRGIRFYNATCPTRGGRIQATAYFTPQSLQPGSSVCESQEWFIERLSAKNSPWYSCCNNWESIGGKKSEEPNEQVLKPTPDLICKEGLIESSYRLVKPSGSRCYTSYEFQCYNKKYEVGKPDVVQIPLRSDGSCMPWAGFKNDADKICKKQYPCFDKTKPIKPEIPVVTTTLQLACNQKCSGGAETLSTQLYATGNTGCPTGYKCVDVNKNCPVGQYCPNVIDYRCRAENCLSDMNCACGLLKYVPLITASPFKSSEKPPIYSCNVNCGCDPKSTCDQVCTGSCLEINKGYYCCNNQSGD